MSKAPGNDTRVRPGEDGWPSEADWKRLHHETGGRLVAVASPLVECRKDPSGAASESILRNLKNPYYLGDEMGLTQTLAWVGAWTSAPSVYAVAARHTADVVAAVNFAREHRLRVVIKGGGHSYKGTSNAADSLLIWTRGLDDIALHEGFVPAGCDGWIEPQPAVTVGAGAIWGRVYDAVATRAGRYVQGGGCLTVGVAGLIQSGGFGSFSKAYGLAAASLLEAEVVTADGTVRVANARSNPELFWGLKGGGGGSLGVVTRLTLATHDLPEFFGRVRAMIGARSDKAFRRLIERVMTLYSRSMFNPHWGEQIGFRPGRILEINMAFQGIDRHAAENIWQPLFDEVAGSPEDFDILEPPAILAVPALHRWDPDYLQELQGVVLRDDRPDAPGSNIFWTGNLDETGMVLYAYRSAWLPATLLASGQEDLAEALFAASRHWGVVLHANKGLAGAPAGAVAAARDTAINPAVLDAFALLICASGGPPAHPDLPGHGLDLATAAAQSARVDRAMDEIRQRIPLTGAYVAESDYFEEDWQEAYWGENYARLLAVKESYDPDGLFFVHHGVGSERWSADGFTRAP